MWVGLGQWSVDWIGWDMGRWVGSVGSWVGRSDRLDHGTVGRIGWVIGQWVGSVGSCVGGSNRLGYGSVSRISWIIGFCCPTFSEGLDLGFVSRPRPMSD